MNHDISEHKLSELKEAFSLFDKDGNKELSVSELEDIMRKMGQYPTKYELRELIQEVSMNPDVINEDEFIRLINSKLYDYETQNELIEAFRLFDTNGAGLISIDKFKDEMLKLGEKLPPEDLHQILKEADYDNDGYINYEELIRHVFTS
jgi:calmodulin